MSPSLRPGPCVVEFDAKGFSTGAARKVTAGRSERRRQIRRQLGAVAADFGPTGHESPQPLVRF